MGLLISLLGGIASKTALKMGSKKYRELIGELKNKKYFDVYPIVTEQFIQNRVGINKSNARNT